MIRLLLKAFAEEGLPTMHNFCYILIIRSGMDNGASNGVSIIYSGRAIGKNLNSTVAYDNSNLAVMSRIFCANAYDL